MLGSVLLLPRHARGMRNTMLSIWRNGADFWRRTCGSTLKSRVLMSYKSVCVALKTDPQSFFLLMRYMRPAARVAVEQDNEDDVVSQHSISRLDIWDVQSQASSDIKGPSPGFRIVSCRPSLGEKNI